MPVEFDQYPQPKRILFVHSSNELYGSDQVLLEIVTKLNRQLFVPVVVLPSDVLYKGELSSAIEAQGIKCYQIKMGVLRRRYFKPLGFITYLAYTVWGIYQLIGIANKNKIDLIHSNTSAVLGGAIVARLLRLPHLWHIHEIIEKPVWLGRFLYRFVLQNSDNIVAVSQSVVDSILAHTDNDKKASGIYIIGNGVDCQRFSPYINGQPFRQELRVKDTELLIGMVGRISQLKGQDLFLESAAQALKLHDYLQIVIVGDPIPGEEERLTRLHLQAKQLGIEHKVHFIPFREDTPQIMSALDFLVSSSTQPESLGLVLLEAMASGRPVIAAAHGGPREIVVDGKTGLLFPPNNSKALAEKILKLAIDTDLRNTVGRYARNYIEQHFSLEQFSQKFESLYSNILSKSKK